LDVKCESDILFKIIEEKYGDRLTEEQLKEVQKGVINIVKAAEALRGVELDYTVEPFTVFKPYRKEG
jgi:hypothetical protein